MTREEATDGASGLAFFFLLKGTARWRLKGLLRVVLPHSPSDSTEGEVLRGYVGEIDCKVFKNFSLLLEDIAVVMEPLNDCPEYCLTTLEEKLPQNLREPFGEVDPSESLLVPSAALEKKKVLLLLSPSGFVMLSIAGSSRSAQYPAGNHTHS